MLTCQLPMSQHRKAIVTEQEINELVARKLGNPQCEQVSFYTNKEGKKNCGLCGTKDIDLNKGHLTTKNYCHSIQSAREIVEKMPVKWSLIRRDDGMFVCTYLGENGFESGSAQETAPMAICLAFLKLSAERVESK